MKREIKFRGLRTDGKGWTIGVPYFIQGEKKCFMIDNCQSGRLTQEDSSFKGKEVIPRTVGQFTGLKDKNGADIYEGDIIDSSSSGHLEVVWGRFEGRLKGFPDHCDELEMSGWCVKHNTLGLQPLDYSFYNEHSVVGNIHEPIPRKTI